MAEKNIVKNKGHVKVVLWRPSIVCCAYTSPFPGWTDSISAAGGITILGGSGYISWLPGDGSNNFDIVPVDFVTNGMFIATAHGALSNEGLHIYNCGTSVQNPITILMYKNIMIEAYKYQKFNI